MDLGKAIEIEGLVKRYGSLTVVNNVSLSVKKGEFLTLLGSSGSGKSTTLLTIAGFVTPEAGEIRIDGKNIAKLNPEKRGLGVVFQNYALFPHYNVFENVAFPLRLRKFSGIELKTRVQKALDLVDLGGYADRRINQLSGGQQQRVALARAFVFEPPVLLMDEPLGALDRKLREQLQLEIKRIQRELGVTVIYVTHDQEEALSMSDRLAIMSDGQIKQIGSPSEVYNNPNSPFSASFLGDSNFIDGCVLPDSSFGKNISAFRSNDVTILGKSHDIIQGSQKAVAMIRPENFSIASSHSLSCNSLKVQILSREYLGSFVRMYVLGPLGKLTVRVPSQAEAFSYQDGDTVWLQWSKENTVLYNK